MSSVLIIDDDKELCILRKKCVEHEGLSAIAANTAAWKVCDWLRNTKQVFPL